MTDNSEIIIVRKYLRIKIYALKFIGETEKKGQHKHPGNPANIHNSWLFKDTSKQGHYSWLGLLLLSNVTFTGLMFTAALNLKPGFKAV